LILRALNSFHLLPHTPKNRGFKCDTVSYLKKAIKWSGRKVLLFFILSGLLTVGISFSDHTGSGSAVRDEFPDPSKWREPRLYHGPFQEEFAYRIVISDSDVPAALLSPVHSENKAYYYMTARPDFSRPGPWSTRIFIYSEREKMTSIDLIGHASYEVRIEWINEKLLFVRVWWGRILGSDFIFDVERNEIRSKEMVMDGGILFRQYKASKDGGAGTPDNGTAAQPADDTSGWVISALRVKLKSGTPQEKEEALNAFMEANLIEFVPDVIEAILDPVVSPRHGDTGWATVHHQAAIAMSRFARHFDGQTLEERGRDKFSFYDDAGIGTEDRRMEIHKNWAAWWERNRAKIQE